MDLSLLAFLVFLFLFLIFLLSGRARPSGQGQGRRYREGTLQDDNLSILPLPVDINGPGHTARNDDGTVHLIDPNPGSSTVDFGSSWDSSTSFDTSSDFGGFDAGSGDLGSAVASEIGGGSDFGGSDFGGGGDGSSY